ncbi:MAG: PaaI family thioesterase [Gammaproteobacteria bacterium]|nr:PaaI family thioesterase [Gammaproteobacteria bacterium]
MSTDKETIDALNAHAPRFIALLGGRIVSVDKKQRTCRFEFNIGTDFCHSVDIVQGGFVTAMLDAAMSHAMFAESGAHLQSVSSLEIKTSFLEPTRAGKLTVIGKVMKSSYKTAFLEGHIYNADGALTATASSVAKLVRPK